MKTKKPTTLDDSKQCFMQQLRYILNHKKEDRRKYIMTHSRPIHLYMIVEKYGLPSLNPFDIKTYCFVKALGLPHVVHNVETPQGSPTGQMPYIEYSISDNEPSKKLADSNHIINFYIDTYFPRNTQLNDDYSDETTLFQAIYYSRFIDAKGWDRFQHDVMAHKENSERAQASDDTRRYFFKKPWMQAMLNEAHLDNLDAAAHDVTQHEKIYDKAEQLLKALSDELGDKTHFSTTPHSKKNATVFALLSSIYYPPIETILKERLMKNKYSNLVQFTKQYYADHVQSTYGNKEEYISNAKKY